jgi:ribosomal protein L7/L12
LVGLRCIESRALGADPDNDRIALFEAGGGAIEDQLKRLSDVAGLPYATFAEELEVPDEVVQLAGSGDTIGAVKRLRELTGASVEQARDIVAGL